MRAGTSVLPLLILATALAAQSVPSGQSEVENVAVFARLYGVVRFFYPSDAAAGLDWNRFAVHGVARVRTAPDTTALRGALERLVAPLGPGIEIGTALPPRSQAVRTDEPLVAWRHLGAGPGRAEWGGTYRSKRTHRATTARIDGFVTLMQSVSAEPLRGKTIRLRGQVRATAIDSSGSAALWLRVDRPDQATGFFDNMQDRPIRDPRWREYVIEGTVADDAVRVAFGVMASGAITADYDVIELATKPASGEWTPILIQDPGFETAAEAGSARWARAGTSRGALVTRPSDEAPEGHHFLRFTPPREAGVDDELFAEGAPVEGTYVDLELGAGLRARVPTVLTDTQARAAVARMRDLDALSAALAAVPSASDRPSVDQRLADVVVAWNVFRHFYPYWTEVDVNWDARLRPHLDAARTAETRAAEADSLRALVADIQDGHGSLTDLLDKDQRGSLPVRLAVVEDQLVIAASAQPSEAPVGAVLSTIDGAPAARRLESAMQLISGSKQWRQVSAAATLARGPKDSVVTLGIDVGAGPRDVALRYGAAQPPPEKRPEPMSELESGTWYVDLTRAAMKQIRPRLEALAAARGVVFDLRGYPGDAGGGILPYLLGASENDRWMHVPKIVGPFLETAGWRSAGWDAVPASPRIVGPVVFLTDARAISYAESVMGYVRDRKLGTVVGAATAGANGNVATFDLPGAFTVRFTGMRVTGHDGKAQHHLVGVAPDVAVAPTIAGLRAGRDEVLEQGLVIVKGDTSRRAGGR